MDDLIYHHNPCLCVMKLPAVTRTPDGWLTGYTFMKICQYYKEDAEWNGKDARFWEELIECNYHKDTEMHWVAHPVIEKKLKEDADLWKKSWVPWEDRDTIRY